MTRKKTLSALLITSLFIALVSSGCYTKLYRPGMEMNGPYSTNQLYNRYDSSAIDTTLTRDDWIRDYYPDDNWYDWGGYRGYYQPRWGFDFYHFSPGYYSSYYGYYDYYGYPWWYRNHYTRPWYYGGGGGSPGIAEPPSQREGRRTRPGYNGGGGSYSAPSGGGAYSAPSGGSSSGGGSPPPATKNPSSGKKKDSSDNGGQKRNGKRRR